MNRTFTIGVLTGLIILVIIGGYFVFYQSGPVAEAPTQANQDPESLFPGGTTKPGTIATSSSQNNNPSDLVGEIPLKTGSGLYQITNTAIGGAAISDNDVYYVSKSNGHLLKNTVPPTTPVQITNTTITKVVEAKITTLVNSQSIIINHWDKDGSYKTFSGITKPTSGGELIGNYLPTNPQNISLSPNKTQVFYFEPAVGGVIGYISDPSFTKKTQVLATPIKEWSSQWVNNDTIALQTKPSANVAGLLYFLNPTTKNFTKIIGNINGLTSLTSPDAKRVLITEYLGTNNTKSFIYQPADQTKKEIILKALPDKCVWSKNNIDLYCGVPNLMPNMIYPDQWYSGEITFSDTLWRLNTNTGSTTALTNPQIDGLDTTIDAFNLFLNSTETNLFFTNKNDLSLWAFDLSQER